MDMDGVKVASDYPALKGRDVLLSTLKRLSAELQRGDEEEEKWDNNTSEDFLEALAALLEAIENTYVNTGVPVPGNPWQIISDVFKGTRYYE